MDEGPGLRHDPGVGGSPRHHLANQGGTAAGGHVQQSHAAIAWVTKLVGQPEDKKILHRMQRIFIRLLSAGVGNNNYNDAAEADAAAEAG